VASLEPTLLILLISFYSANVTNELSADRVAPDVVLSQIPPGENLAPAPIDGSVDKWFFISGAAV
jgi:inorganic pyrophosphatase